MGILSWFRRNFTHVDPCIHELPPARLEPMNKVWAEWYESSITGDRDVIVYDNAGMIARRSLICYWTNEPFEVPSWADSGVILACPKTQRVFLAPYIYDSNPVQVRSFPLLQMPRSDLQYDVTQHGEPPFYYLDAYKFGPVAGAKTGLVPYPPPEGVGETHLLGSDCFWADYDAGYHKMQYQWNSLTVFRYDNPLLPYAEYLPAPDERFADSICILKDNKLHYFVKGHHLGCNVLSDWEDKRIGVAHPVRYIGYSVI